MMRKALFLSLHGVTCLSAYLICAFTFAILPQLLSPLWGGIPLFVYMSPWRFYGESYFALTPNFFPFLGFAFLALLCGIGYYLIRFSEGLLAYFLYVVTSIALSLTCFEIIDYLVINHVGLASLAGIGLSAILIAITLLGYNALWKFFPLRASSRISHFELFVPFLLLQGLGLALFEFQSGHLVIPRFLTMATILLLFPLVTSPHTPGSNYLIQASLKKLGGFMLLPMACLYYFGPSLSDPHSQYLFSPTAATFTSLPHTSLLEIELDNGGSGQISLWTSPTWGSVGSPISHLRQLQVDAPPPTDESQRELIKLINSCLPGSTVSMMQPPDSEVDATGFVAHLDPPHPFSLEITGNCPHVRQILIHGTKLRVFGSPLHSNLRNDQWTWDSPYLQNSPITLDWEG